MKTNFLTALVILFSAFSFSQYQNKDGNRIGITAGISQSSLFTDNFNAKPGIGYNGGLSVRGNYYNNWSMIFGMQFFQNTFSLESTSLTTSLKETEFNFNGAQVRLLLSYNVVKDHVSLDFGPVLQVNGNLTTKSTDDNNILTGTTLKASQIEEISKFNGNVYVGVSAGNRRLRAVFYYQYGFTNLLNNLNNNDALRVQNGNKDFKGNVGTVSAQILFNL